MPAAKSRENIPLLSGKYPSVYGYDEAFTTSGSPFEHWAALLDFFNTRETSSLFEDHEQAKRMRRDDGAIINPFSDVTKPSTSWALDMIPLPISSREWDILERGIRQRATLLEKVVADSYTYQELLAAGKLPIELINDNPKFLPPCHNIKPSGNRFLTFYAADIYRQPYGQFRVLRDYGSNPVGLGYALENRIVMSRLFPDLYHRTRIRRLAPFFQTFHRALVRRASLPEHDPGIVLFSPGPNCPTYFEHALLSRYLGYPLVEGQDLTVRDGSVFLKKLAGLEPVKAIFRHICDQKSDPFALRQDSLEGVAGLIQVCREEKIDVINPIGAGLIDSPLLMLFLPDLCRYLMGEDLLLANHPSWWCRDVAALDHLQEPGSFITQAMQPQIITGSMEELRQHTLASPDKYLVSAALQPAALPGWSDNGPTGSLAILRLFACATDEGFSVMPGGLAITGQDTATLLSNQPEQQTSKDIWVLSDEPIVPFSMLASLTTIPEFKRGGDLPSRIADNLLWLGRYLERAEALVRLLRPVYHYLLSEEWPEDIPELQFLVNLLYAQNIIAPDTGGSEKGNPFVTLPEQLQRTLSDKSLSESVASVLIRVLETAGNVRDRLSHDSFRIINQLEDFTGQGTYAPADLLDRVLFTLNGFSGMAMETMTREVGWRFLDMGRRIERAMNQSQLLSSSLSLLDQESQPMLQVLLEISHSLMTYRGRYRSSFLVAPVLDLLILDETNPRSLAFQIKQISDHVKNLPRPGAIKFSSLEEKLALEMLTSVRLLDLTDISIETLQDNTILPTFFSSIDDLLAQLSEQITSHYLSRVPSTPHYSGLGIHRTVL